MGVCVWGMVGASIAGMCARCATSLFDGVMVGECDSLTLCAMLLVIKLVIGLWLGLAAGS